MATPARPPSVRRSVSARRPSVALGAVLAVAVAMAVAGPLAVEAVAQSAGMSPERLVAVDGGLSERMAGIDGLAAMAREDGWTYTIDVAMVMHEAADRGRREVYAALRDDVVRRLIVDDPSDPFTRGFVGWRWRPGVDLDASGTTEAIRLAEALWQGADAFGRPEDRRLALLLVEGYLAHATVDHGVWLVRNYFNFETRGFATNAFMLAFAPDFLARMAEATGDGEIAVAASRSAALIARAIGPVGLIHELVQPEIETAFPGMDLTIHSPNRIANLMNSCTVVEQVVATSPASVRRLAGFAEARMPELAVLWDVETGDPAGPAQAGVAIYACLSRLAAAAGDPAGQALFLTAMVEAMASQSAAGRPIDWYSAAEAWRALGAPDG